jgi:hypothetical protein
MLMEKALAMRPPVKNPARAADFWAACASFSLQKAEEPCN